MLNVFKSRSFGSLGITSVLILAFLIGLLAYKARNDQWNIWKLNESESENVRSESESEK